MPQIPANIVLVKNIDVIGFYWGSYQAHKPELIRTSFTQLFAWFREGKLKPRVSAQFDLAEAAHGLELLHKRKATGKIVLTTAHERRDPK